ncbi:MAG TPA: FG-GAP-like repeat-containing protein [Falsiroseomonas sp.]|jgi:hypothetical protein|nr:FG-GAP-like repeat-containing protein [Falsiroseomonas sp.]
MAFITGTDNADTLLGTSGDDTLIGSAGNDSIDGNGGFDIVAYWTSPFAVSVRLFANIVDNDGFGAQDTLSNISGVAGSGFGDLLYGSDLGNYMQGLTGNDTIFGLGGDDLIRAGEGDDEVDAGAGTDRMYFFGERSEYVVSAVSGGFRIVDSVAGRDGTDTVLNVEEFQFTNTRILASDILNPNAPGDGIPYPPPSTPPPPAAPPNGFEAPALLYNGFGAAPAGGGWESADRYPRQMADVNGDGRADIVGFGNTGVWVAEANGSGGFDAATLRLGTFGAAPAGGGWESDDRHPRRLADVNGDGRADIVGFGNTGVWVAEANGSGGFDAPTIRLGTFGAAPAGGGWESHDRHPRELADVNGDGRADIVGFGNTGVWVALADGSGGFDAPAMRLGTFGAAPAGGGWESNDRHPRQLADVNGDGRADIVGFGNTGVWVALADGSGGFDTPTMRLGSFGAAAAGGGWESDDRFPRMLADVNGDGRADIAGFGNTGVWIALADGSGGFEAPEMRLGSFGAAPEGGGWESADRHPRQLADVNGDGRADIAGFGNTGVWVALSDDVWS